MVLVTVKTITVFIVLSILSKLLEKHVARAYMKYVMQKGIFYHLQSAFREGHSKETALIKITDQILFNLDSDEVTALDLHNSSADIFADDTTLSLKGHFNDIVNLTNTLNSDLAIVNGQRKIECL